TAGFTKGAGAGTEPDGSPNLTVAWDAGELALPAWVYDLQIQARNTGGLDYTWDGTIENRRGHTTTRSPPDRPASSTRTPYPSNRRNLPMAQCAAPLQICAVKVTKLASNGAPDPGESSIYVSDNFVTLNRQVQREDGQRIQLNSGCGKPIVDFRDCDRNTGV